MSKEETQPLMEKKKMVLREIYRRNINAPGLSLSIVVDDKTFERLKPVEEIRSRTRAHGEDIYILNGSAYVLRYRRSNSGKIKWSIYKVTPEGEFRVRFADLPGYVQRALEFYAEEEGLELRPWEEEI